MREATGGAHGATKTPEKHKNNSTEALQDARNRLAMRVREFLVDRPHPPTLTPEDINTFRGVPKESMQALVAEVTNMVRHEIDAEQPTELQYRKEDPSTVKDVFMDALHTQEQTERTIESKRQHIVDVASHVIKEVEIPTELQHAEINTDMVDLDKKDDASTLEKRRQYTDMGLELMRTVLSDIDDYTIFASSAMYLHSDRNEPGSEEQTMMNTPPGDLDIAMWSREDFDRFQQRVSNLDRSDQVKRVEIDRKGKTKRLSGQTTETWGGVIVLNGDDGEEAAYHFEVFLNTDNSDRLMDTTTRRLTTKRRGLNVLTMEGLQRQYTKNLELEHRVSDAAVRIHETLTSDERILGMVDEAFTQWQKTGAWPADQKWIELLDQIGISARQLAEYYVLDQKMRDIDPADQNAEEKRQARWTEMTAIVGEFKTKVRARKKKVRGIRHARFGAEEEDTETLAA